MIARCPLYHEDFSPSDRGCVIKKLHPQGMQSHVLSETRGSRFLCGWLGGRWGLRLAGEALSNLPKADQDGKQAS